MRILTIPDVHGRDNWKSQVSNETWDKCVFLGDYFDSFDKSAAEQIHNFQNIMKFKEEHGDAVVCLIGNHDHHYIQGCRGGTSGFQKLHASSIEIAMSQYKEFLQAVYIHSHFLFSHAGVSKSFLAKPYINVKDDENLEENLNNIMRYRPQSFMFNGRDPYGDDLYQTPIWIRPSSLKRDRLKGYIHVVGHTTQINPKYMDGVYLTDCESREATLIDTDDEKYKNDIS